MDSKNTETFVIKLGDIKLNIPQKNCCLYKNIDGFLNDDCEIVLESDSYHDSVFISILDNVPTTFNFNRLIQTLLVGLNYFDKIEISVKIKKRITVWVKSLGKYSYTWSELLEKPNYGLELFENRFWPYFNVESKDWQEIGTKVLHSSEYPNQSDGPSNGDAVSDDTEIKKDYKLEYKISQKHNNFLGYQILEPENYTDMSKIFEKLDVLNKLDLKLLMFEAILRLLITPSTCHIIKYPTIHKLIKPLFKENKLYKDLFIHFMYYSMFILNHEYTVMFSKIKRNYRVIFTHEEALNMPLSKYYHMDVNPYIQQLTGGASLVQSIPFYINCDRHINSVDIFERRFYLATGGALANIPLHKYNASVSGSILIPCIAYNELEKEFKNVRFNTARHADINDKYNSDLYKTTGDIKLTEDDKDFMSYLEYLYPSYHSLPDKDYTSKVMTQKEDETRAKTEEEYEKEKKIKPKYNVITDIDISITTDNYDTFEEIAKIIGVQIRLNCATMGEVWIQKVYTASSFKYKIYGPGLIRPIDLFRVPYGPEKMVKKFHCPIVRSWYNGSNALVKDKFEHYKIIDKYWKNKENADDDFEEITKDDLSEYEHNGYIGCNILLSCLSAILSGVNSNYKWFFNSKPCVEVILKYAQRGFSTIVNKKELDALTIYMERTEKWKPFIGKKMDMCGEVSVEHIFFNPCSVDGGIRYKLRKFEKPTENTYSKRLYVGIPKTKTVYDVDLAVKCNNKVYMPDTNKINTFVEYMETMNEDEFSDGEDGNEL